MEGCAQLGAPRYKKSFDKLGEFSDSHQDDQMTEARVIQRDAERVGPGEEEGQRIQIHLPIGETPSEFRKKLSV